MDAAAPQRPTVFVNSATAARGRRSCSATGMKTAAQTVPSWHREDGCRGTGGNGRKLTGRRSSVCARWSVRRPGQVPRPHYAVLGRANRPYARYPGSRGSAYCTALHSSAHSTRTQAAPGMEDRPANPFEFRSITEEINTRVQVLRIHLSFFRAHSVKALRFELPCKIAADCHKCSKARRRSGTADGAQCVARWRH
jgi:hypothetical protein